MKTLVRATLVLMVAAAALVAACLPEPVNSFAEIGRFTSAGNDRIIAVAYRPQIALEELRFYGKQALNTSGRTTTVYFYREGRAVPDVLTGARSMEQASEAIAQANGYRYVFERGVNGRESFVACSDNPQPHLCSSATN